MSLIKDILKLLNDKVISLCINVVDLLQSIVKIVSRIQDKKDKKQIQKKIKKENKQTDDICDNGSLKDLLEKFTKVTVIMISIFLSGCTTEINVITTKQWEGHYFTTKEFKSKTENICLEKNESVWVISNSTLKKILKDNQGK